MITVPPTLLHEQQTGIQQPSEVGACGLWGDPGMARKLARGQRPAIHQSIEHTGPAGITD